MKKFLSSLLISVVLTSVGFAAGKSQSPVLDLAKFDSESRAKEVKEYLLPRVFRIEGVHGIGITGCDPATGAKSDFAVGVPFVHCVEILAVGEGFEHLSQLYPLGTKIKDVYVIVLDRLPASTQPRISGGN